MIDFTKITDNPEVIDLLKQREEIEKRIRELDDVALILYELQKIEDI